MSHDDDETRTSAPPTVVDPAVDPALDATLPSDEGSAPAHQIVIHAGLAPGERVGRYELGQVIGRGGMGVVYEARDPELDRPLAIKVVLPATAGRRSQQRLLDEARAMAKLRHPAVVPVFDVGTTERGVYVVMPLLAGGTLDEWTRAERRPWREVLARYITAGRGLAAAHDAGLVHRDFKPRNVLLGERGEVMVGDFGLAEDTRAATPTSVGGSQLLEGTPAYMAPEHAAGEPVDARADQFSFCVSVWEGLHGERPQDAATRQGGLLSATSLPAVPADRRGAPGWLLSAIARGWQSSPDRRWPSMTALLDHIERRLRLPRRIAIGATAVGVLGAAAASLLLLPGKAADPCPDPRARLATAWSPELRAQVEKAFTATGLSYAPDTLARILPVLDTYAESWRAKHIEVCRAGNVDRTQTSTLLDQRMACLDRRLAALQARSGAFAVANPTIVQSAVKQVDELPPLADCDDTERLLAYPLPSSKDERARITDLERQLDELDALAVRGEGKDVVERLERLLPVARELGFPPVHQRVLSKLIAVRGRRDDSEPLLRELIDIAARARDDHALATAWIQLANNRYLVAPAEEVDAMEPVIGTAVVRAGSPPSLVASATSLRLARAIKRGDMNAALAMAQANVELPTTGLDRALAFANLAQVLMEMHRPKDAIAPAEQAVALTIEAVGERHPDTAEMMRNLAQVVLRAGDLDRGQRLLTQVAALQRDAIGAHPNLAKTLTVLGNLLRGRGDLAGARAALDEARIIFEKAGSEIALSSVLSGLAEVVRHAEGIDAALPLYERSLELFAKHNNKEHFNYAMVESNLAGALAENGRCPEAIPRYAHAVEALTRAKDARLPMVLGASAVCDRDDPARLVLALGKYEAAIEACTKVGCLQDMALTFRFGLGAALHHSERDPRRALTLLRSARADAVANGLQPLVDQIDAWTTKHGVRL